MSPLVGWNTQVVRPRPTRPPCIPLTVIGPVLGEAVVRFSISDLLLAAGERLSVSGSLPQLGGWQPDETFELTEVAPNTWAGEIRVS